MERPYKLQVTGFVSAGRDARGPKRVASVLLGGSYRDRFGVLILDLVSAGGTPALPDVFASMRLVGLYRARFGVLL
jgi:hypothetical protein